MIYNALQKRVVDRAGMPYSLGFNGLALANRPKLTTETRRVPKPLANLFGPMRGLPSSTGPHHNRLGERHG
jgi:hypothetical protein